jgi:glucan biosynthesis protein C
MTAARPYFHDMDAVRAALMLLGLPYHVARCYASNRAYAVVSPDSSLPLTLLSGLLHSFRMEAFFIVAGLFAAMLLSRSGWRAFLTSRALRIGLPMLACLAVLPPLGQLVAAALVNAGFASHADAARLLPPAWLWWVMHLWFLGALLLLTLALAGAAELIDHWPPAARLAGRAGAGLSALAGRRFATGGLLLALLVALAWTAAALLTPVLIAIGLHPSPLGHLFDLRQVVRFSPFFLIGTALWWRPDVRAWFNQPEPWSLPLALAGSALVILAEYRPALMVPAGVLGAGLAGVFWSQMLISFAVRHLHRPGRRRAWLAEASYTIYLFHLPVVLALCLLFVRVPWPPLAEFALITALALAICLGLAALVRRSPLLALLFNGRLAPPALRAAR